jgi:acyl-CoA synthetase (AMP-forming)/AMP-acid ligase II
VRHVVGRRVPPHRVRLRPRSARPQRCPSSGPRLTDRPADVRIVDPETHVELPENQVGEIWVQGPNVADGYWRQPERSAEVFGAVCDGLPGHWLRTGDLGFFHDGLLFVSGRRKDLVVLDGKNHDPADIEASVEAAAPGVECSAVLSVDDGRTERVVLVAEVRRVDVADETARAELGRSLRKAVHRAHGIDFHTIVLVPRGAIPKTSSRKVRRNECKRMLLDSELKVLDTV